MPCWCTGKRCRQSPCNRARSCASQAVASTRPPSGPGGTATPLAEITLMFSHIDHNMAGLEFPEHNFVFTGQLMETLKASGFDSPG